MASVQLSVSGNGEVGDPAKLLDAVTDAVRKAAPELSVTVNVTLSSQVAPEPSK